MLAVFIGSAVEFCVWMSRITRNATQLGARFSRTSGWAVGSFFVPFANLTVPYHHFTEVAEWARYRDPKQAGVGAWWAAWIVSNVVDSFSTRAAMSDVPSMQELATVSGAIGAGVTVVAALLVLRMVRALEQGMQERTDALRMQLPGAHLDAAGGR
jgi:hypothetical protein